MTPAVGLDPLVIALVLLAAVLHAAWNAVLKVAPDRLTTSAVMMGPVSLMMEKMTTVGSIDFAPNRARLARV